MSVIRLQDFKGWQGTPTLVLVDLHRSLSNGDDAGDFSGALLNCRIALDHARARGFPVAFVRKVEAPARFCDPARIPAWIDGFEPMRSDMIFDRQRPSCYASEEFTAMTNYAGGNCVIAGLFGETSCLTTAIDAHHRNHQFTYLADASASRALQGVTAESMHEAVAGIVSLYARVTTTGMWIRQTLRKAEAMR